MDALERKLGQLENALSARNLQPPTVGASTEESQHSSSSFVGNHTTAFSKSHSSSFGLLGGPVVTSKSHGVAEVSTEETSSHSLRSKRYGKSSTSHFALTLKASTFTTGPQTSETTRGRRRLSSPSEITDNSSTRTSSSPVPERVDESLTRSFVPRPTSLRQHMPPHHSTESLYDVYFKAIHPIWPILLEHESKTQLLELYNLEKDPTPLSIVHSNLIISLALQHHEGIVDSGEFYGFERTAFFYQAEEIVNRNAFKPSVPMVQALLLVALYQQGAMRPNACYLAAGHAARMAQSLALHISRPDTVPIIPQHRELHRRLWWSCFCLDR